MLRGKKGPELLPLFTMMFGRFRHSFLSFEREGCGLFDGGCRRFCQRTITNGGEGGDGGNGGGGESGGRSYFLNWQLGREVSTASTGLSCSKP